MDEYDKYAIDTETALEVGSGDILTLFNSDSNCRDYLKIHIDDGKAYVRVLTDGEVSVLKDEVSLPCPVCGRDRSCTEIRERTLEVLSICGRHRYFNHPGGGSFEFENFPKLQISDICDWCDYDRVKEHVFKELKIYDVSLYLHPTDNKHCNILKWVKTQGYEGIWSNGLVIK